MTVRPLKSIAVITCVLLVGCMSAPPAKHSIAAEEPSLLLAEEGRPQMSIVVSAAAPPATRYAAEELQGFLLQMTGAELPLLTDDAPQSDSEILVGDSQHLRNLDLSIDYASLGTEGYILRTHNATLIITGGQPRGTLYGVYGLLEEHLGCRWFTPEVSVIPEAATLAILPINEVRVPVLEYREPFVEECFDGDWAARNRMNGNTDRLEERHGGKIIYNGFVHTFAGLLPLDTYFEEHPEYYSLVGGKRIKDRNQLCCTNEEVIRLVTEEVRRRMAAHPEATVFSVSQNDWYNYCECESCTKLAEEEGSQMAPVLKLVNAVAKMAAQEFPDKLVDTLAYQYTRKPPRTMRPEPNVIIRLCTIECDFAHPFQDRTTPENRAFCDDIEAWASIANRLWIWNYNCSYHHYLTPFPNLYVRGPNIRYMIENNVRGIFEQDVYNTPHGFLSPLSGYLGAKLLWNPNYDTDLAIDEFLSGVYGAAATPMRLYINLLHDAVKDPETLMNIWISPDVPFLNDDIMKRADLLMDAAEQAVADDPGALEHVRIARLSTDYTIMERARSLNAGDSFVVDHERLTVEPSVAFKTRAERFFAVAEKHGLRLVAEHDGDIAKYKKTIDAYLKKTDTPKRLEPVAAPAEMESGLLCSFYDMAVTRLPKFKDLTADAHSVVTKIDTSPSDGHDADAYVLLFEGYFVAPKEGVYTFSVRSNDGSLLWIGNSRVVNNDGLHAEKTVTSFVALEKGYYPFKLGYFEAGGNSALSVFCAGPDIPYGEIPGSMFATPVK